ncbi:hypothetical protein [Nannocystis punicea]|uniref:Uncharacterized protein n=1 Tax=Nannocystis punicea TaxID=2995304 RepID=A0ABY7H4J3_9BACT|nr:hypothetical protein [Nannocystis poenicansa]WAS94198.1 hypothetical protein O0S08_49380 [Nannocystis poenicansa]
MAGSLFVLGDFDAHACSMIDNFPYDIDPAEAAVDDTPPGMIAAVKVGEVGEGGGAGCSDCGGDSMHVSLSVTPGADDSTPSGDIGYELEVVDGEFPFSMPEGPIEGTFILLFSEHDYRVFTATLEVRPVDRAGNVGPGTRVEIRNAVANCNMTLGSGGGSVWLAILALQWFARRRRRGGGLTRGIQRQERA